MKMSKSYPLTNEKAFDFLYKWSNEYLNGKNCNEVQFTRKHWMGEGKTVHDNPNDPYNIEVGIYPLVDLATADSILAKHLPMKKANFVKIGTTTFHELTHFTDETSKDTMKELLISDLSKCHNKEYYLQNWHKFPHEIKTEHRAIISMREKLKELYPSRDKFVDKLILEYVTNKTTPKDERSKPLYPIKKPVDGFKSFEQVESLFNEAFDQSLNGKRNKFTIAFFRSNNQVAMLLADKNGITYPGYQPFVDKLQYAKTGKERDLMMASLVSYLHPSLQKMYPELDFEELRPEAVFGIPIPEIPEDSRIRPFLKKDFFDEEEKRKTESFTKGVLQITDQETFDKDDFAEAINSIPTGGQSHEM